MTGMRFCETPGGRQLSCKDKLTQQSRGCLQHQQGVRPSLCKSVSITLDRRLSYQEHSCCP